MGQLDDVDPSLRFRTHNGVVLCNIYELADWLEHCTERDFRAHVNPRTSMNEIAAWIRNAVGDSSLAAQLDGVWGQKETAALIRARIGDLACWRMEREAPGPRAANAYK